jgi:hypothetical protein
MPSSFFTENTVAASRRFTAGFALSSSESARYQGGMATVITEAP